MKLITTQTVTYEIEVSEQFIREALVTEALECNGLAHEGKPIPGLTTQVLFDGRRGNGTYKIRITRDLAKSGQAQLPQPAGVKA